MENLHWALRTKVEAWLIKPSDITWAQVLVSLDLIAKQKVHDLKEAA